METALDRGIPRMTITEADLNYDDVKGPLFDKCRNKLGYNASDAVLPQRQNAFLLSVLQKAGIQPLQTKEVETYKNAQTFKADRVVWRALLHLSLIAATVALINYCVGRWPWEAHVQYDFDGWPPYLLFGFIGTLATGALSWGPGQYSEWKRHSLKGYKKPVPEFALSYALDVDRVEPKVDFEIEELVKKDRVPDPFLVAVYGNARYYIAVWDEPKFEGRKGK